MKRSTSSSTRKRKGAIKRRNNRIKFLSKELAAECCDNEVDRISELPDDILISIISRLTLREATATSILSTRWQHLHTYIYMTSFNFPPFEPTTYPFRKYLRELQEIQETKFPNYISTINHILDSYKSCRGLKEFKVHVPYLEGANIERWLEFALSREVEIIDIHMFFLPNARHGYCTLGISNLISKNDGQLLPGLRCLKKLSLSDIHVDDGEVELLLSNFPLLESLSIAHSQKLKKVMIFGHSVLKLKHLDISHAWSLESIEVRDMINLVSLRCYHLSPTYVLQLNNIPKLIEFDTSDQADNTLAEILPRIPSCIRDQLKLLKLRTCTMHIRSYEPTYMLPELINIKHLKLEVAMPENTFPLFPLIEACPALEEVEIKFSWWRYVTKFEDRAVHKWSPKKKLSPNIKKLKLSGYLGCTEELEFALFIMRNAVALQELTVEPCDVAHKIRRMATARAWKHFRPITLPITPNSVNLIII